MDGDARKPQTSEINTDLAHHTAQPMEPDAAGKSSWRGSLTDARKPARISSVGCDEDVSGSDAGQTRNQDSRYGNVGEIEKSQDPVRHVARY